MSLFIASSAQCAIREKNVGQFIFINPEYQEAQAEGNWQDVVVLAVKILAHEARTNGGIPGMVFSAAQAYGDGIISGKISEQNEEYAQQLLAMIQQLKAM